MLSPTGSMTIRDYDEHGSGRFLAGRGGRPHYGLDMAAEPDAAIVSPINGRYVRSLQVYPDDPQYKGCEVTNGKLLVKLYYVAPLKAMKPGAEIKAGDLLGTAQNIAKRYPGITPHVHVEVLLNPLAIITVAVGI